MNVKKQLNLTQAIELTKIFEWMTPAILEAYIQDLETRLKDIAVAAIEFGPGADDSFHSEYNDLKEILERAQTQMQVRETVNKY
jgi:hypothetical protein